MDTETNSTAPAMNVEDQLTEALLGSEIETNEVEPETEDSDAPEEASEESTEVDESDVEEAEEPEEEEPEEDLAQDTWDSALGIDDGVIAQDEEGNFTGVNVKIDGESSVVDMKTLVAGFQTNKHNTNTSKALADERRDFEGARDSTVADYTKKLENISKLSQYMHKNLVGEYENIDWNALRQQDPAEYAAATQDFERRKQEIQQVYNAIESERTAEQSELSTRNGTDRQTYLQAEMKKVVANNPEWNSDAKLKAAFTDMKDFVDEVYHIPEDAFYSLGDSRYVEIIKDAMAYRKGVKITQKKINNSKLPKYQKAKKRTGRKAKVSKLDKLTKAASLSSGQSQRDLQTDAIAELLGG